VSAIGSLLVRLLSNKLVVIIDLILLTTGDENVLLLIIMLFVCSHFVWHHEFLCGRMNLRNCLIYNRVTDKDCSSVRFSLLCPRP